MSNCLTVYLHWIQPCWEKGLPSPGNVQGVESGPGIWKGFDRFHKLRWSLLSASRWNYPGIGSASNTCFNKCRDNRRDGL